MEAWQQQKATGTGGRFGEIPQGSNAGIALATPPKLATLNWGRDSTAEEWLYAQTYLKEFELDHVLTVHPGGRVEEARGLHTDELGFIGTDEDGQILDEHEDGWVRDLNERGWEPVTGCSGQYGYAGPIMHPSEFLGGSMAERLAMTPGTYAVVMVEADEDGERDACGWALLRRIDGNRDDG